MTDYQNYLVLDIENNNSKKYGCDAGCFKFDPIVAIGLLNKQELITKYIYPNVIKEFKIDEDILVGHHIAHDLLFLWNIEDLQDFFKSGGRIWDTQYVHYCITGQQHKYPALRDIAVNYYGCVERLKVMEPYWQQKLQTSEIPMGLVLEDVGNDAIDTETVYLKQLEIVKEMDILNFIEFQMDAILATTEMRYNGSKIDIDILDHNLIELKQELEKATTKLNLLVNKYWKP